MKKDYYFKLDDFLFEDLKLNSNDRIIFSIINSLSHNKGYCWATNKQLNELSKISLSTIKRCIEKLIKLNYITRWKRKQGNIVYRFLTINTDLVKKNLNKIIEESKKEDVKKVVTIYDWLNEDD